MSVIDKIFHQRTGMKFHDTIRPVDYTPTVRATGRVAATIDSSDEFVVRLVIEQNFWANQAQFEGAKKYAIKAMIADLYCDVRRHLPALMNAISSGDRNAAFRIITDMEKEITP